MPIDLHEVLQVGKEIEKDQNANTVENTATTSSQHSSQIIYNDITASVSLAEILSKKDLQDQRQYFSMSSSSSTRHLFQSEEKLNIFSVKFMKINLKLKFFYIFLSQFFIPLFYIQRYGTVEKTL